MVRCLFPTLIKLEYRNLSYVASVWLKTNFLKNVGWGFNWYSARGKINNNTWENDIMGVFPPDYLFHRGRATIVRYWVNLPFFTIWVSIHFQKNSGPEFSLFLQGTQGKERHFGMFCSLRNHCVCNPHPWHPLVVVGGWILSSSVTSWLYLPAAHQIRVSCQM